MEFTNLLHFTYWAVFTTTTILRIISGVIVDDVVMNVVGLLSLTDDWYLMLISMSSFGNEVVVDLVSHLISRTCRTCGGGEYRPICKV